MEDVSSMDTRVEVQSTAGAKMEAGEEGIGKNDRPHAEPQTGKRLVLLGTCDGLSNPEGAVHEKNLW
jgi:hypothetical protein